jgi:threonine dehydratase
MAESGPAMTKNIADIHDWKAPMLKSTLITRERIAATETAIRPYIRRTPLVIADGSDFGLPRSPLTFKLEMLQHSGSFKARGAFANLLLRKPPAAGVVAASGGNHGAAVAYAAQRLGVPATIFVPEITSPAKIERIRNYGAQLMVGGARYADALAASEAHVATTGAMAVHAFDQNETLLGQGTVGLELEEGAPTLHMALAAGRPVDAPAGGLAADSLAPKRVGELMFAIARDTITEVALVTDDAIREAQAALWSSLRVVTEPGGAAAFAALLSGRYQPTAGERVAVLICGANTTAVKFEG